LHLAVSEIDEMSDQRLRQAADAFKALAHPARLRILAMLRPGGLYVCQVTAGLELAVSTVSEHLAELKRAGLVTERRDGRWVAYRLAEAADAAALLAHVWELTERDPQVRSDERLMRRLRRIPVEDLCQAGLDVGKLGLKASRVAS
jgi:ArsR family transcriptional regulator